MGVRERVTGLALIAGCACALGPVRAASAAPPTEPARPAEGETYRHSASVSFFSFFGPGVTVEYEHFVKPPALSFVSALGFRTTGGGDYDTLTFTPSLEVRLWLANVGPWRRSGSRAMDGPLLSLREDVAWTSVEDRTRGRLAGTAVEVAETLGVGYRLAIWRLHATAILGGTVTTQMDPSGRLAPITFPSGKLAVTFGVLF